jgi:recombination protein RecR
VAADSYVYCHPPPCPSPTRGEGTLEPQRFAARKRNHSIPMPKAVAGPEIERLIQLLARLPGLGPRSARRAALHLIKKREPLMAPLAAALQTAIEKIQLCRICGNIDTQNPCTVCSDDRRDASVIVVVADVADLWALERASALNARYHVLGGTLSPLDGIGPQDLSIDALISRAHDPAVKEIVLALNATVDGQTTAHYITDLLHDAKVTVTRLAHGVPVGGELDYLDEGTLSAAIRSRTPL